MGQAMNKSKKGGEGDKKDQSSSEPKMLAALLAKEDIYEAYFKNVDNFEDFYHQFHLVTEKLSKESGAMQFQIPTKKSLKEKFDEYGPRGGNKLDKEQFKKIMTKVIQLDSFFMGQRAVDAILFLFGVPIITLLAKRMIPRAKAISDDVVIPAATAGTVVFLVKTNRL